MKPIAILSTGPVSLTGASLILFEILEALRTEVGSHIEFVSFGDCPFFEHQYPNILIHYPSGVAENSGIVQQALPLIEVQEKLIQRAIALYREGHPIILFSTYLFPYGQAAYNAAL